jgi:hypothetical protein
MNTQASPTNKTIWADSFQPGSKWSFRPKWCSNPAKNYSFTAENSTGVFKISAEGTIKSLKLLPEAITVPAGSVLRIQYQGTDLSNKGDFFLFAINTSSKGSKGRKIIAMHDMIFNGKWHCREIKIDKSLKFNLLVLQLYSSKSEGVLRLKDMRIEIPASQTAKKVDNEKIWSDEFALGSRWEFRPKWSSNPARKYNFTTKNGFGRFTIGMGNTIKAISNGIDKKISNDNYLSIRYRAKGLSALKKYFLYAASKSNGAAGFEIISNSDLVFDGKWHIMVLRVPKSIYLSRFILQFFSERADSFLDIDYIRVTNAPPELSIAEFLNVKTPAAKSQPLLLKKYMNVSSALLRKKFFIASSTRELLSVDGVSHRLTKGERDAIAIVPGESVTIPLASFQNVSEIFLICLLDWAGKLIATNNPDQFNIVVKYKDGSSCRFFPYNLMSGCFQLRKGISHYGIKVDSKKKLASITFNNSFPESNFSIISIALGYQNIIPSYKQLFQSYQFPAGLALKSDYKKSVVTINKETAVVENNFFKVSFASKPEPRIVAFINKYNNDVYSFPENSSLFKISANGNTGLLSPTEMRIIKNGNKLCFSGTFKNNKMLKFNLIIVPENAILNLGLELNNVNKPMQVVFPALRDFKSSGYKDYAVFFPGRTPYVNTAPASMQMAYSGAYPFQLIGINNTKHGGGLFTFTRDKDLKVKNYVLKKSDNKFSMDSIWDTLPSKEAGRMYFAASIGVNAGGWKAQINAYRNWLMPAIYSHERDKRHWFMECFTFRQHHVRGFVGQDRKTWLLFDENKKSWKIDDVMAYDRKHFGHIDFLHMFDWGTTEPPGGYIPDKRFAAYRLDGRVGDYKPYKELGGLDNFRNEIKKIQSEGTKVGLYFEGCLLSRRSRAGKNADAWASIASNGKPASFYAWQNCRYVCRSHPGWQNYLASTVIRVNEECDANGYYLDEFGFSNQEQRCHGHKTIHAQPEENASGEARICAMIRRGIQPSRVIYMEEHPADITASDADGSFSHAIAWHKEGGEPALALYRFVVPVFKIFHILGTDTVTSGMHDKYKQVFFNGDGFYLNGPVGAYISNKTAAFVKETAPIMRKYKSCFTGKYVEPFYPSLASQIYVNRFSDGNRTIFTVFNAGYSDYRGELFKVSNGSFKNCTALFGASDSRLITDGNNKLPIVYASLPLRNVACFLLEKNQKLD